MPFWGQDNQQVLRIHKSNECIVAPLVEKIIDRTKDASINPGNQRRSIDFGSDATIGLPAEIARKTLTYHGECN